MKNLIFVDFGASQYFVFHCSYGVNGALRIIWCIES
jgi:hypothetical protein